jgi:hypothetical protein
MSEICDKFKAREQGLFEKPSPFQGPCRYHRGGNVCTRGDVWTCSTKGYKIEPRTNSDDDGEID